MMLLLSMYTVWVVIVLVITAPLALVQRVLVAGPLLAIGGLLCGMGYLSSLRRRALRRREGSLQRLLEQRRRERTK